MNVIYSQIGWDSSAYLSEDGNESVYALESEGGGEDEEGGEDDFMAPRRAPQPDQVIFNGSAKICILGAPL